MGRKPLFDKVMSDYQYTKRYLQKHPEKIKQNNDANKDYKKKWYLLNRDRILKHKRELYKLKKLKKVSS